MAQLIIHRLDARLRTPAGAADAVGARLKRLVAEMAATALEPALRRNGLGDSGELCIRRVVVPPLRLDLGLSDARLVEGWADAWAAAIVREASRPGHEVLRYGSRAHALADLLAAVGAGDLSRAWAWRRLGLWPADGAVTPGDATGFAQRALLAEPQAAVVVLAHLAAEPARFSAWLRGASPAFLRALAEAAWRAAGAPAVAWAELEAATLAAAPPAAARAGLVARSAIARAASRVLPMDAERSTAATADRTLRTALAVLALAQAEPALLRAPIARLASWLAALAPAPRRAAEACADEEAARVVDPATMKSPVVTPRIDADREDAQAPTTALPDLRRRGRTAHAGVLFLLNLAADLGWPAALLDDAALAARSPRWCLHQLAMRWLALSADDPAALAFAGLPPGSPAPDADAEPPEPGERRALAALGDAVCRALRRRLRERGLEAMSDDRLLAHVCRRHGEIVADPGWLEAHLALADVDIDLRVAGLDLDPGWVPWLGIVVRFVHE